MKKIYIGLFLLGGIFLLANSFMFNSSTSESTDTNSDVEIKFLSQDETFDLNEFMSTEVFPKLEKIVSHDPVSMFSRCMSGFHHNLNDTASNDRFMIGSIYHMNGCNTDISYIYKIDVFQGHTFLKKNEFDRYVSIDEFVKNEIQNTPKI